MSKRKYKDDVFCRINCGSRQPLASTQFSDCTFIVHENNKKEIFHAHKCVLASASPVFEAMLYGPMAEKHFPICVPDISIAAFGQMVQCIYRNQVVLHNMDELCQLWIASHKYQLEDLNAKCAEEVTRKVKIVNVAIVLDYALHLEDISVETECCSIIADDPLAVLKCRHFVNVTPQVLNKILSLNSLNLNEIDLFDAVERWARARCERESLPFTTVNIRQVCEGAVEKIRFLAMTAKQFTRGPAMSNMLTSDETFAILMSLPEPKNAGSLVPYPNLSKVWRQRRMPYYHGSSASSDYDSHDDSDNGSLELEVV